MKDVVNPEVTRKIAHLARLKLNDDEVERYTAELAKILDFVAQYAPKASTPMCGNSISQDRRFLVKYMPRLEAFFHYRNIDVSTLKELAKRWRPDIYNSFKKQQKHTALADVHESIDELAHYRAHFLKLETTQAAAANP